MLREFTENHKDKDRIAFKKEWNNWVILNETQEMINNEILILNNEEINVIVMIDKMFLSVRFYIKKDKDKKTESPPPIIKISNKHMTKEWITLINDHIKSKMSYLGPNDLYQDFILIYGNQIELMETNFKKSYKNRYYSIIKI
jgi:hypothetical protein